MKAHGRTKRIIFESMFAEDDWNIIVESRGTEPVQIPDFKSKAEIDERAGPGNLHRTISGISA